MDTPVIPSNLDSEGIRTPPRGILASLRYMGPGLILSAAIVGSGELIATTTLGARAGFTLLWVVLLGCVVKVAVQIEYGRFCLNHGLPTLQAWNRVGAPKPGSLHWTVYVAGVYMIFNMVGQAGVLGGASQVAHYAAPEVRLVIWMGVIVILIGLLISHGKYGPVETIATGLNLLFVLTVLYCVVAIQRTSLAFTASDLAGGFSFRMPPELLGLAIAAFGITGVAAGEITMYPYWLLEKGYARWTGPNDGSPEWRERARGWTRVMTVDAVASMFVYTVATCAFYVLGATALRAQPELEDGNKFIVQLSAIFTQVLGEGSRGVFMLCAFTVLFSTVFANAAGFSRLWADWFGLRGWLDWRNEAERARWTSVVAWAFPVVCAIIYLAVQSPLLLVTFMGVCNALYLAVVAYQTVIFRYRHTPPELKPSRFYDLVLWVSLTAIALVGLQGVYRLIGKLGLV